MEIKITDIEGLALAAQQFVQAMGEHRVFAFYGKMGAGKTTFIKAICEALGVEDVVTSPTFAIVNEYIIDHSSAQASGAGGTSLTIDHSEHEEKDVQCSSLRSDAGGAMSNVQSVYHFDFYRIKNLREAYDIGTEEYFYSGSPCFIEWPEMIEELLPEDTVRVSIEVAEDGSRIVSFDA